VGITVEKEKNGVDFVTKYVMLYI